MFQRNEAIEYQQPGLEYARALLLDPNVPKVMDFDDTIARTSHQLQRVSVEKAFEQFGMPIEITPEYGATYLRGKTGRDIMATVFETITGERDEALVEELTVARNELLVELVNNLENPSLLLTPGMEDLVRLLRTTHQHVAISTQSPEPFVRAFNKNAKIDGISIDDVLDPGLVVGSDLIGRAERRNQVALAKPHAISVTHGAKRLVQEHTHVLYIGDSETDALTVAGKENITGIIVNGDPAKRERLRREFSAYDNIIIIGSLAELMEK